MTTTRFRVPQMDCATEKEVIARNGLRLLRWRRAPTPLQ